MENQVRYIARTIVNPDLAQKHWSTMKGLSIFRNNPTVKNFATFYEGTNNALDKRSNYSNIINTMDFSLNSSTRNGANLIGKAWDGSYWKGSMSDVRIYNRALSQEEIKTLYNSYNSKIIL